MILGNLASPNLSPGEIEEARQGYLHELGVTPTPDNQPGGFGCHELLDRSHLLSDQVEDWLLSHPACLHNPEWFALAYQAWDQLHRLYQVIGEAHLTEEAKERNGTPH